MTEPLIIDTLAVLQAQYASHTLLKAPFRRELPNPTPKPKGRGKRKERDEGEARKQSMRQLTRSEQDAATRHRSVAPWLYIAQHLVRTRWLVPCPLPATQLSVPSLTPVSAALRAWAATADAAPADTPTDAPSEVHSDTQSEGEGQVAELSGSEPCARLFRRLWRHTGAAEVRVLLATHTFVLPARCAFVLAHAPYLAPLLRARRGTDGFGLVLADPPWENASARRAAAYASLAPHELRALPVAQLVATRAYVAIWVTNKEPLIRFACNTLLPAWGATHVATALWLKLTSAGELVCPIDPECGLAGGAPHRPYEVLVVGRVGPAPPAVQELETRLLSNRVLASDAGQRHSRKPPLDALFKPLLNALIGGASPPACLELFAREVREGWTCWGNEVLLFNERDGNFE